MGSCVGKPDRISGGSYAYRAQKQPPPPPAFPIPQSYNLPKGWVCEYDWQSKHLYYVNNATGRRQWDHPNGATDAEVDASKYADQMELYEQSMANYTRTYGDPQMSQAYYNSNSSDSNYSASISQDPFDENGKNNRYTAPSGGGCSGMGKMAKGGMMGLAVDSVIDDDYRKRHEYRDGNSGYGIDTNYNDNSHNGAGFFGGSDGYGGGDGNRNYSNTGWSSSYGRSSGVFGDNGGTSDSSYGNFVGGGGLSGGGGGMSGRSYYNQSGGDVYANDGYMDQGSTW
ncbi:hypothetical protein BGZ98_008607 [Dissophora globulifera]|nr:hypothetical protein BGZ98_008607 [Dissophora globulifera]